MREALLLVFVIAILILILVYIYTSKEGFFDASDAAGEQSAYILDRQKQYGNIGISLLTADNVGALGATATPQTTTPGSIIAHPLNIQPTGLFATIKTCEAIKTMDCSAFNDPEFSLNCGMCLDVATNSKNVSIPGGGLVVLDEEKQIARQNQVSDFMPNYVPTVGFCPAGKLVTTKDECLKLQRQLQCQKNQSFDLPGCAQCYTDGSYTIVDPVANPGVIAGSGIICVSGSGYLTIVEQGFSPVTNITLTSGTSYKYSIQGAEGNSIGLNVSMVSGDGKTTLKVGTPLYIAGYVSGATFTGEFDLDLMQITLTDRATGRKPRASGSTTVDGNSVTKIAPGFGQTGMQLVTTAPFSFVDTTTQEAYLCQNGPFITKPSSSQVLNSDPCYAKGSGPGNYSMECLQNIWITNGCTQSGKYYPSDASTASLLMANPDGSFRTSNDIADFIYNKALLTSTGINQNGNKATLQTWSDASVFCTGVAITNPCESPTKKTGPLSDQCLVYLWKNGGVNDSIGATYPSLGGTSLFGTSTNPQFCQVGGTLSPVDVNGNMKPDVIAFWQQQGGIDAVKQIMSNLYVAANAKGSTDAVRMPYFTKCYGEVQFSAGSSAAPGAPAPAAPAPGAPAPAAPAPPPPPAAICLAGSEQGLPPCKNLSILTPGSAEPACGMVVSVFDTALSRFNFAIPVGQWNNIAEIKSIPGNNGYTIHGGDNNATLAFPKNCRLKLTINNGDNFNGPLTYVFTKTCSSSFSSGACGQINFDKSWDYARSIKCEEIT